MFLSYEDTLHYLYAALPMFQRIGPAALKPDLTNTWKLCTALDNPQTKFKSIHIAGTNGKGSSAHMLASILQDAGYKTGLYTSPHLKDFRERIRIDGQPVAAEFIVDFVSRVKPLIDDIQPSFFEITVAMAFAYFSANRVDIAVVEVGLGGRLDSTNVIQPEVSLITNIGWDHKELLGNSLEKIAFEKAGIIKHGVPVVISERQPEVEVVFREQSESKHAPVYFASDLYSFLPSVLGGTGFDLCRGSEIVYADLSLGLSGFYQLKNILGVVAVIDVLRALGWHITDHQVRSGLQNVAAKTGLKGRWQILGYHPLKVCDTAHNAEGMKVVVSQIKAQSYETLHMVFGMVNDKDVMPVLQLLPREAQYYFCQAKLPRAMDAAILAELAEAIGLNGVVIPDVSTAIHEAELRAKPEDMIFIGGSTFIVAEIENL